MIFQSHSQVPKNSLNCSGRHFLMAANAEDELRSTLGFFNLSGF